MPLSKLKLLNKILRLKGMKITPFWFKNRNKALHLAYIIFGDNEIRFELPYDKAQLFFLDTH